MLPSQIRRVVLLAETRRPKLGGLSQPATNGRHPDGTRMPGPLPGALDCYETRWERFRAHLAVVGGPAPAATASDLEAPA